MWEAAGSEPLFLMQGMGTQRSRPEQEEGEKEDHMPLRLRAARTAPTRGPGTQGTVEAGRGGWCKSW